MIDTKFVCTLAALVASVVVICNYDKKENFVENFAGSAGGMPQFQVRAERLWHAMKKLPPVVNSFRYQTTNHNFPQECSQNLTVLTSDTTSQPNKT